ncbi:MAG: hypothetical protein KJO07_17720 [Deltaproteobacteria bacterium]|nr:hypothetical protein [Deltaproteobacteria bacterium]
MKTVEKRGVMAVLGRSLVLALGLMAAAASANQNRARPKASAGSADSGEQAPASKPMDAEMAVGLWKSSFGPVKLEVEGDQVQGVWVYDRQGSEVIGYFEGPLDGNVLEFEWVEPAQPTELKGSGYLVFDPDGRAFAGKWWTHNRDRSGAWNGWRTADTMPGGNPEGDGAGADGPGGPATNDGVPGEGNGPAEQAPGPPPDREYL